MSEIAMIITALSVMYLTAWSYKRHDGTMSGVTHFVMAVAAVILIGAEFIFCMIRFTLLLHWTVEAGLITAMVALFTTCIMFNELGRRTKANKEKWGKSR